MKKVLRLLLTLSGSLVLAGQYAVPLISMEQESRKRKATEPAEGDHRPGKRARVSIQQPKSPILKIEQYIESHPHLTMDDLMRQVKTVAIKQIILQRGLEHQSLQEIARLMPSDEKIEALANKINGQYRLKINRYHPIFFAAALGNIPLMSFIAPRPATWIYFLNQTNSCSVAHYAAYYNQPETLDTILSYNRMLIESMDGLSNTPLHIAAQKGNAECVKILLKRHARVNARNSAGQTPLALAHNIETQNILQEHINRLPDRHPDKINTRINNNTDEDWNFYATASNGDTDEARHILMVNPTININALNPHSCWEHIIARNDVAMARTLITTPGINVNIQFPFGETPLIEAAQANRTHIVQTLAAISGINANATSPYCYAALIWASLHNNLTMVLTLLEIPGIDVNVTNHDNITPLMFAVDHTNIIMVQALLAKGADATIKSIVNKTAFDYGNQEIKEILYSLMA